MTSIDDVQVSSVKRTITVSLTPEEAEEFRVWFNEAAKYSPQPPYVARLFLGTIAAIARNREYGGPLS